MSQCAWCGYSSGGHAGGCLGAAPVVVRPTLAEAVVEREEAIATADDAADEAWKARCAGVIRELALLLPSFTSDEVWDRVEKPREPRCLIGVLRRVAGEGVIEATGDFAPSRYRHAAPLKVWRSLVVRPSVRGVG